MSTDLSVRSPSGFGFARKLAPFGIPAVAGYLVALVPSGSPPGTEWLAAAGALLAFTVLVTAVLPWDRMPRAARMLPPVAYIGVVALMRMGTDGSPSTYVPLLLLPLVWLALYGTRGQLLAGFVTVAAVLFLTGPSTGVGLQGSLLVVIVTPAVCFTIHRLVMRVRRQAALLEELASSDRLTGSITRRAWESALERELVRARRTGEAVTIGFIDFDSFQRFNERFGADAGDDVLKRSVAAWNRELRAGDLLGRMNGDDFGVALPACTAEQALEVVERLRVATVDLQTCSIGLAQWTQGESARDFIDRAQAALGTAKKLGRDRTVVAGDPAEVEAASAEDAVPETAEPAPAENEATHVSVDPTPLEDATSADVLAGPTLLEQAAVDSRSLIAELHAVAQASVIHKEDVQDGTPEETLAAAAPETAPETSSSADTAAPAGDDESLGDGAAESNDSAQVQRSVGARAEADESNADSLALVSESPGSLVTVEDDLDGLLSVRGAQEIRQLLRDLSSIR